MKKEIREKVCESRKRGKWRIRKVKKRREKKRKGKKKGKENNIWDNNAHGRPALWYFFVASFQTTRHIDSITHPIHSSNLIKGLALRVALEKTFHAVTSSLKSFALLGVPFLILVGIPIPSPFTTCDTMWSPGTKFGRISASARENIKG
jgi:hypothetical protein